jgi:hypothetical protein
MKVKYAYHISPIPYISYVYGDLLTHERRIDQRNNHINLVQRCWYMVRAGRTGGLRSYHRSLNPLETSDGNVFN